MVRMGWAMFAGEKPPRRLVEKWLKGVVITSIDDGYIDRKVSQPPGRMDARESSTHDDDARVRSAWPLGAFISSANPGASYLLMGCATRGLSAEFVGRQPPTHVARVAVLARAR